MKEYQINIDLKAMQMFLCETQPIDFEDKSPITVVGEVVNAGEFSDLHGFFISPCRYLGKYEDFAVFDCGTSETGGLFPETKYYYDLLLIPSETTIAILTHERCAASWNWNKKLKIWK